MKRIPTVTITRSQVTIASIFICFLVLQVCTIFYDQYKGNLYPDERTVIISKLLAVYSVHLAVIVGGIFGQQIDPAGKVPQAAFWLAVALSLVWNLILSGQILLFVLSPADRNDDLISQLNSTASASSFLVTAALAYFFTKR